MRSDAGSLRRLDMGVLPYCRDARGTAPDGRRCLDATRRDRVPAMPKLLVCNKKSDIQTLLRRRFGRWLRWSRAYARLCHGCGFLR